MKVIGALQLELLLQFFICTSTQLVKEVVVALFLTLRNNTRLFE